MNNRVFRSSKPEHPIYPPMPTHPEFGGALPLILALIEQIADHRTVFEWAESDFDFEEAFDRSIFWTTIDGITWKRHDVRRDRFEELESVYRRLIKQGRTRLVSITITSSDDTGKIFEISLSTPPMFDLPAASHNARSCLIGA